MDILGAYRRHLAARKLRPASIRAYLSWLTRLDRWAECGLLDLTTDDLEEWLAGHSWAPASHHKAVQAIKAFYAWAVATDRIERSPAEPLIPARAPRGRPDPCPENVYADALARSTGEDYWRLRLAAETGLRRAELAVVHSSDVRRLVNGPALRVVGKGGVERHVPLPDDLALWIEFQRGYVFPGSRDGHMDPDSVGRWYKRHARVKAHRLRHRYATLAYASSHDLSAVQDLLGHASPETTRIYVQVAGEDLHAAAAGTWQPIQRPDLQLVE